MLPHVSGQFSGTEARMPVNVPYLLHFSSSVLSAFKGKLSDMKSTWSQGPISQSQASLSHELWKVPQGPRSSTAPSRPPPGLTNNKPSSTWGGNSLGLAQGWSGSYSSGERSPLNHRPYRNMVMSFSPLRFFVFFFLSGLKVNQSFCYFH